MTTNVNSFRVTYATGKVATYRAAHDTVDGFVNEHFGSTWAQAQEHGAMVELLAPEADDEMRDAEQADVQEEQQELELTEDEKDDPAADLPPQE